MANMPTPIIQTPSTPLPYAQAAALANLMPTNSNTNVAIAGGTIGKAVKLLTPNVYHPYAFISDLRDLIRVLDLSDLTNITLAASVALPAGTKPACSDVAKNGKFALVIGETSKAVISVDLTNPTAPVPATPVSLGISTAPISGGRRIQISDDCTFALFSNKDAHQITMLGLVNPLAPEVYWTVTVPVSVWDITIAPNCKFAMTSNWNENTIMSIGLDDLHNPVWGAQVSVPDVNTPGPWPTGIAISRDCQRAYVCDCNDDVIYVFDLTNPMLPVALTHVGTDWTPEHIALSSYNRYALALNVDTADVTPIDLTNYSSPVKCANVHTIPVGDSNSARSISISPTETFALLVTTNATAVTPLNVMDLTNPLAPTMVAVYAPSDLLATYEQGTNFVFCSSSPVRIEISRSVRATDIGVVAQARGNAPVFDGSYHATLAPGTDVVSEYEIPSNQVLGGSGTITWSTAGSPNVGWKTLTCRALALGHTLALVNGGPAAGTLYAIAASLAKPVQIVCWWDGINFLAPAVQWVSK